MQQRTTGWMVAVLVASSALVATAAPVSAGGRDHFTVVPGQSIQAAIDAASPGATIEVQAGVYHENLAIEKNDIRLISWGAQLRPPETPTMTPCDDIFGGHGDAAKTTARTADVMAATFGICIGGNPDVAVRRATVTGWDVAGFMESGIIAFNARDTTVNWSTSTDNGGYGIAAFNSFRTRVDSNHVAGNTEAGIYIGDSPAANAKVTFNESDHNGFGVFLRDSQRGTVQDNNIHDNCVGILNLADSPGPAGDYQVSLNAITHNNAVCPANEEQPFPLSGIGVAVVGGHDMSIHDNHITQNVPAVGGTPFGGGVVVISGLGGTPPVKDKVWVNTFVGNAPDITWDGTGTGNKFVPNWCATSVPASICS